ncbi:MAG: hypothetical protein HFJ79_07150 [Clostridiales bacterium]|jgi:hypothetical protein|nr:hypothetical protein [Clostridiales bacterium]
MADVVGIEGGKAKMETKPIASASLTERFVFCIEKRMQENVNVPLSAEGLRLAKEGIWRLKESPLSEKDRQEMEKLLLKLINTIFGDGVLFGTHAAITAFTEIQPIRE